MKATTTKPTTPPKNTRARKSARTAKDKPDTTAGTFQKFGLPQPGSFETETAEAIAAMTRRITALAVAVDTLTASNRKAEIRIELLRRENAELRERQAIQSGEIMMMKSLALQRGMSSRQGDDFAAVTDKGLQGLAAAILAASLGKQAPPWVHSAAYEAAGLNDYALGK
jgi:hypothetical protein